jgi:acyl carrier protein
MIAASDKDTPQRSTVMRHAETVDILRTFLVEEVLDGPAAGLTADTPLLEWGILTSMSTMRLVSFIGLRLGVQIPVEEVVGTNFKDLNAVARLVESLAAAPQPGR